MGSQLTSLLGEVGCSKRATPFAPIDKGKLGKNVVKSLSWMVKRNIPLKSNMCKLGI